eukprot:1321003-Lingulodinium_polyedra.AAC.1
MCIRDSNRSAKPTARPLCSNDNNGRCQHFPRLAKPVHLHVGLVAAFPGLEVSVCFAIRKTTATPPTLRQPRALLKRPQPRVHRLKLR